MAAGIYTIFSKQNEFWINVPPDLSQGARMKPGEILRPSAYTFALFAWREVNTWQVNGQKDYLNKIKALQCYFSPEFNRWLRSNYKSKLADNELNRTREVSFDLEYDQSQSIPIGANTFEVTLVMGITERVSGNIVKESTISYPLKVVPTNQPCNRMGMEITGFTQQPIKIKD